MGVKGYTWEYREIHWSTRGYMGVQEKHESTGGDSSIGGYMGVQEDT